MDSTWMESNMDGIQIENKFNLHPIKLDDERDLIPKKLIKNCIKSIYLSASAI